MVPLENVSKETQDCIAKYISKKTHEEYTDVYYCYRDCNSWNMVVYAQGK